MAKVRMTSLNVNGMGNPVKRRTIFGHLRAQKADIHLLQETHSSPENGFLWAREWGGQAFFSHGSSGSKGVAILVDRDFDLQVISTIKDTEGRFLGLDVRCGGQTLTISSIYAPTQDKPREQKEFLETVSNFLSKLQCTDIVLGGDFNCITDTNLDKNRPGDGHPQGEQGRNALRSLLEEWNLMDIWRV